MKKMFAITIMAISSFTSFAQQAPLSERPEWAKLVNDKIAMIVMATFFS